MDPAVVISAGAGGLEHAALLDPLAFIEGRPGRVAFNDAMELAVGCHESVRAGSAVGSIRRVESTWMRRACCSISPLCLCVSLSLPCVTSLALAAFGPTVGQLTADVGAVGQ